MTGCNWCLVTVGPASIALGPLKLASIPMRSVVRSTSSFMLHGSIERHCSIPVTLQRLGVLLALHHHTFPSLTYSPLINSILAEDTRAWRRIHWDCREIVLHAHPDLIIVFLSIILRLFCPNSRHIGSDSVVTRGCRHNGISCFRV